MVVGGSIAKKAGGIDDDGVGTDVLELVVWKRAGSVLNDI